MRYCCGLLFGFPTSNFFSHKSYSNIGMLRPVIIELHKLLGGEGAQFRV